MESVELSFAYISDGTGSSFFSDDLSSRRMRAMSLLLSQAERLDPPTVKFIAVGVYDRERHAVCWF